MILTSEQVDKYKKDGAIWFYSNKINRDYVRFLTNNFNKKFKILTQNTKIIFSKSINPFK